MRYKMWANRFKTTFGNLTALYWTSCVLIGVLIVISANYLFNVFGVGVSRESFLSGFAFSLVFGFVPTYDLIILGLLPKHISKELHEFRSTLDISNSEFYKLRNRILYSPISIKSLWTLNLLILLSVILSFLTVMVVGDVAIVLLLLFFLMLIPSFLVVIKISIVLWHVFKLQNQPLRINVLDTYPLRALARLTRTLALYLIPITAILGLLGVNTLLSLRQRTSDLSWTEMLVGVPVILSGPALIILSICVFIFPVLWVRRLIIEKKKNVLSDISAKLLSSFIEHDRLITSGDLSKVGVIATSIDALHKRQEIYKNVSEWPWETRVFREFVGALLIPIILWIAQFYLTKFFDGL
jgi:hypothetical protein